MQFTVSRLVCLHNDIPDTVRYSVGAGHCTVPGLVLLQNVFPDIIGDGVGAVHCPWDGPITSWIPWYSWIQFWSSLLSLGWFSYLMVSLIQNSVLAQFTVPGLLFLHNCFSDTVGYSVGAVHCPRASCSAHTWLEARGSLALYNISMHLCWDTVGTTSSTSLFTSDWAKC